jgi:anti-sigma-K factor RskA
VGDDAIHALTAAYALDALDEREEAEYEAHLGRCTDCQVELASFQTTASALAYAVEAPAPSPGLRARILEQARSESRRAQVIELAPRRRWAFPALAGAAAAAAVVALALGLWATSLSSSLDEERQAREAQAAALAVVGDPDAERFPLRGTNGTLLVAAGGEAALVLRDLGSAPEGKLYEVWVSADGDVMLPAGTFDASTGVGATVVSLSRPVPQNGLVAVTVEDEPVDTPGDPIITARTA